MKVLWWTWAVSALTILGFIVTVGYACKGTLWGVLIDNRARYSLSRFNVLWWTTIVLSLVSAVAVGRFTERGANPFGFSVPHAVIGLIATVGGTTVASTAVKGYKDRHRPQSVAASPGAAFFAQMLMEEEGSESDDALDVGKVQAFVITVLLGAGYCLTAAYQFLGRSDPPIGDPSQIGALPDLDATFVTLLALSATGYVGGKLVNRSGIPAFSVDSYRSVRENVVTQGRVEGSRLTRTGMRARISAAAGTTASKVVPPGDPQPAPRTRPTLRNGVVPRPSRRG